ncbi:hypothetical protein [Marinoscillum sp.]|uniref:hypothetical protein n=1 Tax=Marinoscillum sp. TaxID=2024838 RepID=UPI003BAD6314
MILSLITRPGNLLRALFDYRKKRAYEKSYQVAGQDQEMMDIAEEVMEDYLNQLKSLET